MLYKGPVEDKVEMLEDDVVNMVSPVLCEDDKSRNQKSSFLVHLKVSEDSQEKTGGCTTTQWFGILASTDGRKTMQDCDWSSLKHGEEVCDWSSPNARMENDSNLVTN